MIFCPRMLLMLIIAPHEIFIIMTHFRITGRCLESPCGNKQNKYSFCIMYDSYTLNWTWSQNITQAKRKFKSDPRLQSTADWRSYKMNLSLTEGSRCISMYNIYFKSNYFIYRMWFNKSRPLSLQTCKQVCVSASTQTPLHKCLFSKLKKQL